MKTKLLLVLALLGAFTYQLTTVHAQGTAFTYQGRLNANNAPATGNYDLTFTLFSASSGAGQVGTPVTNTATAVSNGLFTVTLDFGANFAGASRWLEIGARTNGAAAFSTLAPRQSILPTPYAITAASANSVAGANISGTLDSAQLSGTYAGVLTLNNAANTVSGNGAALTSLDASQLTSGTVSDARISANVALLNRPVQAFTGGTNSFTGKVGIGTSTPGFPLNFPNTLGDKISLHGQSGDHFGFGIQLGLLQIYTINSAGDIAFGYGSSAAMTETMRIKGNGNVGIGTTTPGFPLNFANTVGDKISLYGNSGNSYGFGVDANTLQIHSDSVGSDISFGYGSSAVITEKMRIKGTGNVGIGTNNPSAKLEVVGTVKATAFVGAFSGDGAGLTNLPAGMVESPANVIPVRGMAWIKPGTFIMGSRTDEPGRASDEGPQTVVTLTKGFWMGVHEVTQSEYQNVIGSNPSYFTGDSNRPVEQVSWSSATNYCLVLTLSERTAGRIPVGWGYRLPTEAEWEYVCRAGPRTTRYCYDDDLNATALGNYAWYLTNAASTTHPAGQKLANPWGMMDMHGNVWEWCQDWYGTYPGGSVTDPQGAIFGLGRVTRGGSWGSAPVYCRSAQRADYGPSDAFNLFGFRVVLSPGQP